MPSKSKIGLIEDPILVVCFTNHALDQFLEGILNFCPDGIIRVGSRSSSELLENFNLKKVREKTDRPFEMRCALKDCYREMDGMKTVVEDMTTKIKLCELQIIPVIALKHFMTQMHSDYFKGADFAQNNEAMRSWLNTKNEDLTSYLLEEVESRLMFFVNKEIDVLDDSQISTRKPEVNTKGNKKQ